MESEGGVSAALGAVGAPGGLAAALALDAPGALGAVIAPRVLCARTFCACVHAKAHTNVNTRRARADLLTGDNGT
jgi:hypothetical protein